MNLLASGEAIKDAVSKGGSVVSGAISASYNLDQIHGDLNDAVKTLLAKRDDYWFRLQRHKSRRPTNTYKDWVDRVTKIENDMKELETRYEKENKRPRTWGVLARSNFYKEMKDKHERVCKLLVESNQLGEIMVDPPPNPVEMMGAPEIQKFCTLQKNVDKVLDFLENDKVNGIRIHGTVGIGKTAIMLTLNNHEQVGKMFDIVIWVKVSMEGNKENLSTEQLQRAIARRLKLDIESTSDAHEVAKRISEDLEGRRYLLLLDDVKQDLNLYDLGIPENKNGSKIVLTTRIGHVCSLIVNRNIKVNYLSQAEAWEMFGDVLECPELFGHKRFSQLAWKIVNKCGGLPLVIKFVASDFRMRKCEDQWIDGLNNFRNWPDNKQEGMEALYKLLNFCYNNLNSAQKNCFCYGALYSEDSDIPIDCLLECWAAENFLGSDDDVDKQRDLGRRILEHLKNVSLLEEGMNTRNVRMHKIIRQAALHDSPCKHLVKTNEALRKPPDRMHWLEKNWISLIDNELQTLPDSPECSMLSTLFLQKNSRLTIPASFFSHMETLQVLDLSRTGIVSLPQSLSKVFSLKVLYLKDCRNLMKLPSQLEELQHLEVLDLRGTGVKSIPHFIEKLVCLRRLLVTFPNDNSAELSSNCKVISKLAELKELVIAVEAPRKQWGDELLSTTLKEIVTLKLSNLQFQFSDETVDVIKMEAATTYICVPDAAVLSFFIRRDDLCFASFQVCIGLHSTSPEIPMSYQYERYMKCESHNPTVSELLTKADAFELINHRGAENLMEFVKSMNQVRGLLIESCNDIQTIVDGNSTTNKPILPNLEQLYIRNSSTLKSIWEGHFPSGILCKLKTLVVNNCKMLVKIFSQGFVQQLSGIQLLEVQNCSEIEKIMESDNYRLDLSVLPNLEKMTLHNLPKLRIIYENETLEWHSLKELEIHGCPRLSRLPFTRDNASNLKSITTEKDWWDTLQWRHHEVKEHFQQYCTFSVMAPSANAVDGTEAAGGSETYRGMSATEAPSRNKRRPSATDKGKAVASPENGKRIRIDQSCGSCKGISIRGQQEHT